MSAPASESSPRPTTSPPPRPSARPSTAPAAGSTTGTRRTPGSGATAAAPSPAATSSCRSTPSSSASASGRCGAWSCRSCRRPASSLTLDQQFWLIAVPSLVGATIRIPYTFAVPVFGRRNWTIISALLLLLPAAALAWVVTQPDVLRGAARLRCPRRLRGRQLCLLDDQHLVLLPEAEKGRPWASTLPGETSAPASSRWWCPRSSRSARDPPRARRAGLHPAGPPRGGARVARMDNLSGAKADYRAFANATRNRHTWIISFLYIGTFGSFIGYSGAFPTLLKTQFPEAPSRWPSSVRWSARSPGRSAASSPTGSAAHASPSPPSAC